MSDLIQPSNDAEFARLLFEQAGMAMVATDVEGRITRWNAEAGRMFGAAGDVMVGAAWESIIPEDDRPLADSRFKRCLEFRRTVEFEFDLRDEHGRSRRLATILTPIVDADGGLMGTLSCVRDITNRVILQKRLTQQSRMAALGEMAGALSHHFNNILGGVVTSVDFAMASGDADVLSRVLRKTSTALGRATELMDGLLAFAQGAHREAGLCELGEAIVEVLDRIEPRLERLGIRLDDTLDLIPVVEVPRSQVMTLLNKLIENAIEAMEDSDNGVLSVRLTEQDESAVIRVGDTGVGLSEDAMGRVFEPFYSTKNVGSTGRVRHGLGLAVAHGIVKVLHGSVTVQSNIGRGTMFEVRLPIRKRDYAAS